MWVLGDGPYGWYQHVVLVEPFSYPADLAADLEPYLKHAHDGLGPVLRDWLSAIGWAGVGLGVLLMPPMAWILARIATAPPPFPLPEQHPPRTE